MSSLSYGVTKIFIIVRYKIYTFTLSLVLLYREENRDCIHRLISTVRSVLCRWMKHLKTFLQRQCGVVIGRGDPSDLPVSANVFLCQVAWSHLGEAFSKAIIVDFSLLLLRSMRVSVIMVLTHKYRCENSHRLQHKREQSNTRHSWKSLLLHCSLLLHKNRQWLYCMMYYEGWTTGTWKSV